MNEHCGAGTDSQGHEGGGGGGESQQRMTPNTTTSASSLWQYMNDSIQQYGGLDLMSKAAPVVAGVGLVLDTREQRAKSIVKTIEREMAEVQGKADKKLGEVLHSCSVSIICVVLHSGIVTFFSVENYTGAARGWSSAGTRAQGIEKSPWQGNN